MERDEFSDGHNQGDFGFNGIFNGFGGMLRSDKDRCGVGLQLLCRLTDRGEKRKSQVFTFLARGGTSYNVRAILDRLLSIGRGDTPSEALVDDSGVFADVQAADSRIVCLCPSSG